MKKAISILRTLTALCMGLVILSSCHKDDPAEEIQTDPAPLSELPGLYTFENFASEDSAYIRVAVELKEDKSMVFYADKTDDGEANGVLKNGKYEYNVKDGFGKLMIAGVSVAEFYADRAGFIALRDEDEFQEGLWLGKQSYGLETFNKKPETFECEYEDSFGCTEYDPARVLDIDDIGYQDDAVNEVKASEELTISGVVTFAAKSLVSGGIGAVGGSIANVILSKLGLGMGAQLNKISGQLTEIQSKLSTTLLAIKQVLNATAEVNFNNHIGDRNTLSSSVERRLASLPTKISTKEDTLKVIEVLTAFDVIDKGPTTVVSFIENTLAMTVDSKNIYQAYDSYIYCNYIWEVQGYVPRESFRALDMMTIVRASMLSMLYFDLIGETENVKIQAQKLDSYLKFYENNKVVRNHSYANCQLTDCKMHIGLDFDKREFNGKHMLPKGYPYKADKILHPSMMDNVYNPGPTAAELAYRHESIPLETYFKQGLTPEDIKKLAAAHKTSDGKEMSLYDILFNVAKCNLPYSKDGQSKVAIMRTYTPGAAKKDQLCVYAGEDEVRISGYTKDDANYTQYQVGKPKLVTQDLKWWQRIFYAITFSQAPKKFEGWETYNDQMIWVYPQVIHRGK